MRGWVVVGLLGVGLGAFVAGSAADPAKVGPWLTDLATARQTARLNGLPLLIVFR